MRKKEIITKFLTTKKSKKNRKYKGKSVGP